MTITLAWWIHEQIPDHPVAHTISGLPLVAIAGSPYDVFIKGSGSARRARRAHHAHAVAKFQHRYMARRGMLISKSSAAHFAQAGVGRLSPKLAARIGARVGARLIPGLGWAMLAYDVYTVAGMISD